LAGSGDFVFQQNENQYLEKFSILKVSFGIYLKSCCKKEKIKG